MQILCCSCYQEGNKTDLFTLQLAVAQVLLKIVFFLVVFLFSHMKGEVKYFPALPFL